VNDNTDQNQSNQLDNLNVQPQVIQTDTSGGKIRLSSKGKTIATIVGVVLLVVGVAAGVLLVQQQQEFRERASSGAECQQASDCILLDSPGNSGSFESSTNIRYIFITNKSEYRYEPGETNDDCYNVSILGRFLNWSKVGSGPECKDISNIQIWIDSGGVTPTEKPTETPIATETPISTKTPTETPSVTATPIPQVNASCDTLYVYKIEGNINNPDSWTKLNNDELSQLKAGDTVYFTVVVKTDSGEFTKARFNINGNQLPEVTTTKPGSFPEGTKEFYEDYTIPENTIDFSVNAEGYHSLLGWI
jgi:hypothetical protein